MLLATAACARADAPAPPSTCAITCELQRAGDHPRAVLTVEYKFRTGKPWSRVLLGGRGAFATAAQLGDGGTPLLESTADGLVAAIEAPGEHALSVTYEVGIVPRGGGNPGFEIGLPRAAITTLKLLPPSDELKVVTLGTRPGEAAEIASRSMDAARLATAFPLGPTNVLELSWEQPKAAVQASTEALLDADISVHVDEQRIETTAVLGLLGPPREWQLSLPTGAEVAVTAGSATIAKPEGEGQPWRIERSAETPAVLLTVLVKRERNGAAAIGPFFATGTRQAGTIRIFAPPQLRVVPRPAPDVRRIDAPGFADDDAPSAAFRFDFPAAADRKPGSLVEFDLRPAAGFIVAQPNHRLTLTPLGWKLRSEYRISPVRTTVESLTLELPAGWQSAEFSPLDIVDDVLSEGDGSTLQLLTVVLDAPRREPFELILETRWPVAAGARSASLPMPRLVGVRERDVQAAIATPDTLELSGSLRDAEGGALPLVNASLHAAAAQVDSTIARVDLAWQPARPRFMLDNRVDATLTDRQISIVQTLRFAFSPGGHRTVLLSAGRPLAGFESQPPVQPGSDGWTFTPPADAAEAVVVLRYAVPASLGRVEFPIVWAGSQESTTHVQIWSASGRLRIAGFDGPWRETPPLPGPELVSMPVLSLQSTGDRQSLALRLTPSDGAGSTIVDRAAIQWWLNEGGSTLGRARYHLARWPAHLDLDLNDATLLAALVDDCRCELVAGSGGTVRLVLPEPTGPQHRIMLDLRFSGPPLAEWRSATLSPPRLRGAVYRQPLRWHCSHAADCLPLVASQSFMPVQRWRWSPGVVPVAAWSDADLDRWLRGEDSAAGSVEPGTTGRQTSPEGVRAIRLPKWPAWIAIACLVALIGSLLSRPIGLWGALLFATVAALVAAAATLTPQPLIQMVPGVQLGMLLLAAGWVVLAVLRWLRSLQSQPRPTFARSPVPIVVPPSSLDRSGSNARRLAGSSRVSR